MNKKNIYIIVHNQFGYQTDYYNYCKYLLPYCEVHYICWNQGKEKLNLEGVTVTYVEKKKRNIFSILYLIVFIIKTIRKDPPEVTLIKYFPLCSLIQLSSRRTKYIIDVRTASVSKNEIINFCSDLFLHCEYRLFKHSTVLSQEIKKKLSLKKASVIPLGADIFDSSEKDFGSLRLLYVGSLNNRDIEKTIYGLKLLLMKWPDVDIKYTIIGSGSKSANQKLINSISINKMTNIVNFVGPVPFTKLASYFQGHNVGVSFIPMTKYYDKQPPTKTYEYLMSGMPVLATRTFANAQIINDKTGVLINDTSKSFAEGLEEILLNRKRYSSSLIRSFYKECTWRNIVTNKLYVFLKNTIDES